MLRILLLFGFCAGVFANQADAKTIRYEFDVVQSYIEFVDLKKYEMIEMAPSGPFYEEVNTWETGEYEYYLRKLHPFGSVYGLAGKVVMDLHVSSSGVSGTGGTAESGSISCVSGFLCLLNPISFRVTQHVPGFVLHADISTSVGDLYLHHSEIHGRTSMFSPGSPSGGQISCDYQPDCLVAYWWPSAHFGIANFSHTEITPVPLPASASLLAVGLMAFGIKARRRKRAA